jgi:trehalose 6-phosphate phosphatase
MLPLLARTALLIDLDGTLLDIAPTPDAVVVPSGLLDVLHAIRRLLGDAVAVITGRPVETVEALLGDAVFAVAGEHGAAIRYAPGGSLERAPVPPPPASWLTEAERLAAAHPGALLEVKARGFTLHYRAVPAAEQPLRDGLMALLQGSTEFELMPGRMLWEVRPRGADKGTAVIALMSRAPFLDRLPVFIGDDVTDEDGIAAAKAMGGAGLRVPDLFGDAAGVRCWLQNIASSGEWPVTPAPGRGRQSGGRQAEA